MTTRSVCIFLWFWLFIIPLTYNFWGLDPALYSKFLLLDISLLGASIVLYMNGGSRMGRQVIPFLILYGVYICLSAFSLSYYHINTSDGWFIWLHLFTLPVMVSLLSLIDSHVQIQPKHVAYIISCMAGVAITIGIAQYLNEIYDKGWYMAASDQMRSVFAHKNIFSEVMLLTLPFSLYAGWYSEVKNRLPKFIAVMTALAILVLLSRAVWLGLLVASIVSVSVYFFANGKWRPKWYHGIGILCIAAVCYLSYQWFIWHTSAGDYLKYFYNQRDTVNERKHLWSATWQMIKTHPLTGCGLGSWKVLNMRYAIIGLRDYATFFQQPHNDYLWVISEQGLFASIAGGSAWFYVLLRLFKQIAARPSDMFLYCLLFALTGYAVYSGMAFPKERAEHGIILAFIVFFILSQSKKGQRIFPHPQPLSEGEGSNSRLDKLHLLGLSGDEKSVPVSKYLLLPVCIVLMMAGWWSGQKLICERHLRLYFEERSRGDVAGELSQLHAISPRYFALDGTATPIAWYRGMLHYTQGDIATASIDFDEAVRANPYHVYSLTNAGTCIYQRGDREGAANYFRQALSYSPGFTDAALNMCAIKYDEGQIDSAAYYLGMVRDSLSNERYSQSLNLLTGEVLKPLTDPTANATLQLKLSSLLKKSTWQMEIFKKAYIYHHTIKEQVLMDVIWSVKYQDHDSITADEIQKQYNITIL